MENAGVSRSEPMGEGASAALAGLRPPRKLSVLMPIYNERWTLAEILARVLSSPVPLEIEVVAVDDGSSDGSWEGLQRLAAQDPRIRAFRHPENRGKGTAIRAAIEHATGDIAVTQDADLEYDPHEYPLLLRPILEGKADAVYGTRFVGHTRRVLFFWHSVFNRLLTLLSNAVNDMNLTDMETGFKMIRLDILKELRLRSRTFTFEPEVTCRLAQWGARVYEVPVSYFGRTYDEGKKVRPMDGLKALWEILRCRFLDPRFTTHDGFYTLACMARAKRYNSWIMRPVERYLGSRILEAGSGIGTVSLFLLGRERLVLVDRDPQYVVRLRRRFAGRSNVRIECADIAAAEAYDAWREERLDTVLSTNVLEHIEDDEGVLRSFHRTLAPGGHCVIIVPACPRLYTGVDRAIGHYRRYGKRELRRKMAAAGFEIVFARQPNKVGAVGWFVAGHILRRRHLSPRQVLWFNRCMPAVRVLEHLLPVPGMSLVMVGRKAGDASGGASPAH